MNLGTTLWVLVNNYLVDYQFSAAFAREESLNPWKEEKMSISKLELVRSRKEWATELQQ